ncbi:haloacid dehalogenase-like hydrolase [Streptomyces sp. NBC_00885]|uniref:HAD family hydrolase n=1 Tax=Streptomyces sp. NBC_00885 TaxID=2975857 RepID=UPI0038696708|nr:haloacid dehalogenase-like hydrolase [Streptomyces sp. NBC_00885]
MAEAERSLVLWDIDRTLLYVGEIDRQVYRETFAEIVGYPVEHLPAPGTGVTMPLAIRAMLMDNGVPEGRVPELLPLMIELLPKRLAAHTADLRQQGKLMPGAVAALRAVRDRADLVPTVVTGNLKANAVLKLGAFDLESFVDTEIGGYASDDYHRPSLVGIAQKRAQAKYGVSFGHSNSVIIGDSLEDVRTGRDGGDVPVIGIASGTTSAAELERAGADVVLRTLEDVEGLETAITELLS